MPEKTDFRKLRKASKKVRAGRFQPASPLHSVYVGQYFLKLCGSPLNPEHANDGFPSCSESN